MNNFYSRLIVGILLIITSEFIFIPQAKAQFTITENFKSGSVSSKITLGGNPTSILTSGIYDPINDGWLRLTSDNNDQRGFAYINTTFPSSIGAYIEFEYKTWRSKADNTYFGADGICVFLFDATQTFSIGAFGGSLGYANRVSGSTTETGLSGGYIGIGLDEYGNFVRNSEGKNGGTADLAPNSIALRGPQKNSKPYRYLTHTQLQTNSSSNTNSIDYNTVTSTRPTNSQFYRKVKIYIEPIGTIYVPKYRIRVLWTTTPNGTDTQHISYETTDPIPALLKLGFGASTGGGFNYHEIRNLYITTPGNVRINKEVDKPNVIIGDDLTYTLTVTNETPAPLTNLVLNDTIKDGNGNALSLSDFEISSITFNNKGNSGNTASGFTSGVAKTSGFTNPFSTTLAMAPNSTVFFTVVGKAKKMPAGGIVKNSVEIDPTGSGISDTDLTNNYATVNTTILNPNVDLKIEKGVNNNGIARLSGNTYTITVSNVSSTNKPSSERVTVTDNIPAGLNVTSYTAPGWTVSNTGNNYTFTRTDALASVYAYPSIVLNVTPTGTGPWVNTANLSYTYDTDTSNNSSSVSLRWLNYWRGNIDTDWAKDANWTANYVPMSGENIEFATVSNNGPSGNGNGAGAAVNDLYLDKDRIIGDLTNNSDMSLVVTTQNQLTINGTVNDNNFDKGTIIVKTSPDEATGTLIFTNPATNLAVNANVEFYNKAYECSTCGYYKRQWQYFGIPVNSSEFPSTGLETVNQWVEPYSGDKWRPAPYNPDTQLKAFKGYEMTNSATSLPDKIYNFTGTLNVGDAIVPLTKTSNVNYSGMNLIGNSYTAAIPISTDAITFGTGLLEEETVYLFNTGTRDQWRKLNGSTATGISGGQYQAVPFSLAGQATLPDRILSMHTFMLNAKTSGSITLKYAKLGKNELINQSAWRSLKSSSSEAYPHIIMDVIGDSSADRVWLFENPATTNEFDNGWDGYKLLENGLTQVYVSGTNKEKFQIATVPQITGTTFDVKTSINENYTLNLSVTPDIENRKLYLRDLTTGHIYPIVNNGEYAINGKSSLDKNRFDIVSSNTVLTDDDEGSSLINITVNNNVIVVTNMSEVDCLAIVYDLNGKKIFSKNVKKYSFESFTDAYFIQNSVYIVKVADNKQTVKKTSRIFIK